MSLLLLLSLACSSGGAPPAAPESYPQAAMGTTFASTEALGAYILESHVDTTTVRGAHSEDVSETTRLRWQDSDHWQWEDVRDGKRLTEVRVWEGVAWRAQGAGELERQRDPATSFTDLRLHSDPWTEALGTFVDRVAYTQAGEEDIESRKVWRYTLGMLPAPPGSGRSRELLSLEGQLWIDQITAVRLAGDLTMQARFRDQVRTTHLRFAMASLGADAGVEAPAAADAP